VAALARMLEKWIPAAQAGAEFESLPDSAPTGDSLPETVMDFARLQEFRDYDDEDLTMTREVIGMFRTDAPLRLDAMAAAIAAGDRHAMSQATHALKGSAGNVGATAIQRAAAQFEALAADQVPPDAGALLSQLRSLWEQTEASIDAWNDFR